MNCFIKVNTFFDRVTIDTIEELVYSKIGVGIWGEQNKGFFLMSDDKFSQEIGAKAEHYTDPLLVVGFYVQNEIFLIKLTLLVRRKE